MAHLRGDDKRRYVAELFARISPRYDLMNSLMTGGLHHRWKRDTARLASAGQVGPALDVATGTGDLAFALARCPGIAAVVGVDLLPEMLRLAAAKLPAAGDRQRRSAPVHFVVGDALRLPLRRRFCVRYRRFQSAEYARCAGGHRRGWRGWSPPAGGWRRWS